MWSIARLVGCLVRARIKRGKYYIAEIIISVMSEQTNLESPFSGAVIADANLRMAVASDASSTISTGSDGT